MHVQKAQDLIAAVKKRRVAWPKVIVAAVAGLLIFQLGVGVGSGRLQLGPDAIFHKPMQKGMPENLNYSSVEAVYDKIRSSYDGQLDQTKLLDGLKAGLAQSTGDPYTEYFNQQAAKDFGNELNGTFTGIGAELGKDADNNIVVIAPLAGYPAEKAGLKAKDIIVSVDGNSTAGQGISEVVNKIRGQADTKVSLKVIRDKSQELTFDITRAEIKVPSVKSEIIDGNIGYLNISRFGDDTSGLASDAANQFKQAGVKGVILDLRDDPGGLLPAAVDVSSLWVDSSQTVLQEKRGGVVTRTYKGTNANSPLKGIPTVVLINDGSASASEITAGALRDNKAATLIGTKSFGKGSVQELDDLGDGSMVKVTIAHWFTPSGKGIDKQGLEPDQKVDRTADDITNSRDPQKQAAIDKLTK